jgi:hypothetical protein
MDAYTAVSLIAIIIGAAIGIAGYYSGRSKDARELSASIAAIKTSLAYIEQDTKDIKAEVRRIESDVAAASETAVKALATAEAAHDRLDVLGIETASKARARRANNERES